MKNLNRPMGLKVIAVKKSIFLVTTPSIGYDLVEGLISGIKSFKKIYTLS